MLQRISPWLAAGLTTGLVIIFGIWLMAVIYFNTFLLSHRPGIDQKLVGEIVKVSVNNPEVRAALKNQVIRFLKSPEGKKALVELIKSPEMINAMSEELQSPQMRAAVLELMQVPEFRNAVLQIVKDTPEMRILTALASAVVLDPESQKGKPSASVTSP